VLLLLSGQNNGKANYIYSRSIQKAIDKAKQIILEMPDWKRKLLPSMWNIKMDEDYKNLIIFALADLGTPISCTCENNLNFSVMYVDYMKQSTIVPCEQIKAIDKEELRKLLYGKIDQFIDKL
jgi:hypothetical protein